jgi:SAM-dependent methyltransferase
MTKQNSQNTDFSGLEELHNIELMKNYNSYIVKLAMKYANKTKRVVDFGAGIGTLSSILRDSYSIDPICIEIDKKNKDLLNKRGFSLCGELSSINGGVDLIFSSNVLEHIEDDISVMRKMSQKLNANGKIFLYLPAKMILWSNMDEEVGHYRRYEYKELIDKCEEVGLKIDALHFVDSLGFFAALLMKLFGYNKDSGIGSVSTIKFYDKWLLPVSIILDGIGFKYFLGKNIALVASNR